VLNHRDAGRLRWALAQAIILLGIVVLICVPALTRTGQKLEISSHAPSFAKNVDCPPKKVTVAPVLAMTSPIALDGTETVGVRFTPAPDTTLPRSPFLSTPKPLRAPPVSLLA
jgi:hypothetical protein